MAYNPPSSLLQAFLRVASNRDTSDRHVMECGSHAWTYAELDAVSSAMAQELSQVVGQSPKVASVAENHPYIFALMLSVWKLGGIFIPMDAHIPRAMLISMTDMVKPQCVVLPASDTHNKSIVSELNLRILTFDPTNSTIPALNAKYGTTRISPVERPIPHTDHSCLYLFTSSATSSENLKAVPLTHGLVLRNCVSKLAWWRRTRPNRDMDGIRVLGWAPWSHVLSYMQDIGTATLLNAGCYVFALVPTTYRIIEPPTPGDLTSLVIDGLLNRHVQAFACLPFVLNGLKVACEGTLPASGALLRSLRSMIMLECGGAMIDRDVSQWASESRIPLVVGIGMTETGGTIFGGWAEDAFSGFSPQGLISDAEFSLMGDEIEGELVVKSRHLPHGYINRDDGSFSVDQEGLVTFRTGDRYRRTEEGKFMWLGRTTDFVQMSTGENLDPRPIQSALCASRFIRNACVIGDTFLNGPSTAVCAIIEIEMEHKNAALLDPHAAKLEVVRVLAPINRDLPPAVRIAWSSILILAHGETIPVTSKGEIFRKKIEAMFGESIKTMHAPSVYANGPFEQGFPFTLLCERASNSIYFRLVEDSIAEIVGKALGVSDTDLLGSMSFAELGMTSLQAIQVADMLSKHLDGRVQLPPNICYIHLDLQSLISGINDLLRVPSNFPGRVTPTVAPVHSKDVIVIIGKAFRLPGHLDTDTSLWERLLGKSASAITEIPTDRWDHASFFPDLIGFNRAGLVDVANYDHTFFGLTATEALYVSPTMRLALEVAFEALENANIPLSKLRGSKTGVYVATKDDGFETLLHAAHGYDAYTRFYGTGRAPSTASGRISYLLDVCGPSITVDTACSGGIVCMDQAVTYLQSGAGDTAIVCSSNTHCWPGSFMFLSAQSMTSPNSRCAAFTSEADGYVPSEGAVGFILKTRSAAIRDRDHILATIKGTEVAHNGRSQGLVAPNMKAQAALHRSLLRKAQLHPGDIDFVETHGTGTSLGDLCEIQGINEAFFPSQERRAAPLILGASKSALGHTEASAGLVGILAVLLSFQRNLVPGLAHLREDNLNPMLDCSTVPLMISAKPISLPSDKPLTALVMSYGFSGTLADIALQRHEPPALPSGPECAPYSGPMIFALSAKSPTALTAYIDIYLSFLKNADPRAFHSICYTTCVGREHYKHRFACVATDLPDLIAQVERRASLATRPGRTRTSLAFAFPGQGTHYPGMAAALAERYTRFRELIVESGRQAQALCGAPIDAILLGGDCGGVDHLGSETDQMCIFIYQYSVCRWLKELGIGAQGVIGHSLGEITAAVIAGGLPFEVALDLVVTRGRLLRSSPENPGGMAAIACTEEVISQLLAIEDLGFAEPVSVSVINGPQSVVVSGAAHDVDTVISAAKDRNLKATRLNVKQGFHSARVDGAMSGLRKWSASNSTFFTPLQMDLYSTLLGARIPRGHILAPEHWVDHARQPVQFSKAAVAIQGNHFILDIGPQAVAWSLLLSNGHAAASTMALSVKKGSDQEFAFLTALAALFQDHQVTPDFYALYSHRVSPAPFETMNIPTYPFQRVHRYPSYIPTREPTMARKPIPMANDVDTQAPQQTPDSLTRVTAPMSVNELREALMNCIRETLEIGPGDELDDSETLGVRGVDSIMFAQLQKRVEECYGLHVSIVFSSDAFSIADMVTNLVEQYAATAPENDVNTQEPRQTPSSLTRGTTPLSVNELQEVLMNCIRETLEIGPGDELDDSETLSVRGVDSIMFAQLQKRVEERYGLHVSIVFSSDAFSIADMVTNLVQQYTEQL
ncbi:hypothetical protein DFH07DRAFT_886398 [Mycena maculata]|uniref:Polyketide synthase n=1 Tax=Mycena maculata TaxID=230809 RepID=A0AAD7IZY8_9AGAR|nr:hypothetical protein DFH07DRAFT_886398 [Mycena maculata]